MSDKWIKIANISDVEEDEVILITSENYSLTLYKIKGEFYATDNICTHGNACLTEGYLDGNIIECPRHQGRFNVKTGKALCSPVTTDIRTYPCRLKNISDVEVNLF